LNYFEGDSATETAGIWLVDRALQWHHLADSFLYYYRMALVHLGLPEWQYTFTDIGVSPQAKVCLITLHYHHHH